MTVVELLERGDVCTVEELADVLKISRGSAYAGVRSGELPGIHCGARWIVPVRQIAALLGVSGEPA